MAPAYRVTGLCAAPFTPFNTDGSLDLPSVAAHVDELVRQGVKYAFVAGTTGEGVCMSVAERKQLLEAWMKAAHGKVEIIAHIAAEAIVDVQELAKHAESVGVAALGAHCTTFNKPPTLDAIVDFLGIISKSAPKTPLYYYHIAVKTGVNIRCDQLLKKIHDAPHRVPTFNGVKFTDFDLHIMANCIAFAGGQYDVLSGRDEVLLAGLAMGCKGAVGSTYNYMGKVYNQLMDAFAKGDMAAALAHQRTGQVLIDLLNDASPYGTGIYLGKAIMEARLGGKHCGPPRHPLAAMTPEGTAKLHADLGAMGFFKW